MVTVKFLNNEIVFDPSITTSEMITKSFGLAKNDFYLLQNGKRIVNGQESLDGIIHVVLRTVGGKGGFGSMLRAIGAQIEKTTNREACRDLSGRRLRDINEEKRLKNWISQKEEKEREAREKRRQKLERLCQEPKVVLSDETFVKQRSELTENISDSIEQGLKASSSGVGVKRKCEGNNPPPKKTKGFLLDIDLESDEDVSSSEDESSNNLQKVSNQCSTIAAT